MPLTARALGLIGVLALGLSCARVDSRFDRSELDRPDAGLVIGEYPLAKNAVVVGTWTGDWRTAVDTEHMSLKDHCEAMMEAIAMAQAPATIAAQAEPKNEWLWHPLVDGCEGSAEQPGEPPPIH